LTTRHWPPGRTITGTDGPDTLTGGNGPDVIDGGRGSDSLSGGKGADTIHGGLGSDTMAGGAGADTFTFGTPWIAVPTAPPMWDGGDVITDFEPGLDKLDFSNLISDRGYDATFIGAGPLSTSPPFSRDPKRRLP
jgi:Ca2+-binding RTX toxin-like protein